MQNQIPTTEQAHIDAGVGRRTANHALGCTRAVAFKSLAGSTLLAAVALTVWSFASGSAVASASTPGAQTPPPSLASRAWDRRHLGPNGLQKCRAFRLVLKHTTEAQTSGGGTFSSGQAHRLQVELNVAKKMPPASLTPAQCGVPL